MKLEFNWLFFESVPIRKNAFSLLFLHLDAWDSLRRMMYVWSLTLNGCFHIHLLNFKSQFKTWMYNGRFCDITTSFEANATYKV